MLLLLACVPECRLTLANARPKFWSYPARKSDFSWLDGSSTAKLSLCLSGRRKKGGGEGKISLLTFLPMLYPLRRQQPMFGGCWIFYGYSAIFKFDWVVPSTENTPRMENYAVRQSRWFFRHAKCRVCLAWLMKLLLCSLDIRRVGAGCFF